MVLCYFSKLTVVDRLIGLEENKNDLNVNPEIYLVSPSHFNQQNIIKQMPLKLTTIITPSLL